MFFLPITLDALSTWRRRLGALNPQERRILRDTFFSSDEKFRLSRAYHRAVEALAQGVEPLGSGRPVAIEGPKRALDALLRLTPGEIRLRARHDVDRLLAARRVQTDGNGSAIGGLLQQPTAPDRA